VSRPRLFDVDPTDEREWTMAETWKSVPATDVQAGDEIRLQSGQSLLVSRIEPAFMGRAGMIAFIEDTPDRWFKQPMPSSTSVEVRQADQT
jgi:hypothetical protein